MGDKSLSPKTIANVHGLLSALMSTATKLGYRTDNPCVGVELPMTVSTRDEMTVLTQDEFALLLAKIPAFYQPLMLALVACSHPHLPPRRASRSGAHGGTRAMITPSTTWGQI